MKALEVVALLQARLPAFTNKFSDSVSVATLTNPSGVQALATTSTPHGLIVGGLALVVGAESNIAISSLTRNGIVGTLSTDSDHDVTKGLLTIEIDSATESEFNGTFTILNVTNRRTITFVMADSGATTATGSPVLVDGESAFRGYNGLQTVVTVPNSTSFTYTLGGSSLEDATGTITIEKGLRISAGGTIERLIESYSKQPQNANWMFVVLGDVIASKSRHISTDGVDNQSRQQQGDNFKQQLIQSVTIYTFIPTADSLSARMARDESEDLFPFICGSILFHSFGSGLAAGSVGSLAFTNHGIQAYNAAFYVHQYSFEQTVDLTYGDTVGHDIDVAFRDISLIMKQDVGSELFTAEINLDDEAL